jgi:hypothetical protein
VSAVPRHFVNETPENREPPECNEPHDSADENDPDKTFWHWFALAALLFAWIAEATMCAERGF